MFYIATGSCAKVTKIHYCFSEWLFPILKVKSGQNGHFVSPLGEITFLEWIGFQC